MKSAVSEASRGQSASLAEPRESPLRRLEAVAPWDAPPAPPPWVERFMGSQVTTETIPPRAGQTLEIREGLYGTFCELRLAAVAELPGEDFEEAVGAAYDRLLEELRRRQLSPLRFWNFVPGILRPCGDGLYRYERFNLGRFGAFRRWYGGDDFGPRLAAASAVDCHYPGLTLQVLAAPRAGTPVENPRQIPAYRYSERFGPLPPCFARASVVEAPSPPDGAAAPWVVVSGTASVLGEDSRHPDDLRLQTAETLRNLATIVAASTGEADQMQGRPLPLTPPRSPCPFLSRLTELRAYVVRPQDQEPVAEALATACPEALELEVLSADLCRPDLLVEVEGLAVPPPEA